jgi:hypothetical protein
MHEQGVSLDSVTKLLKALERAAAMHPDKNTVSWLLLQVLKHLDFSAAGGGTVGACQLNGTCVDGVTRDYCENILRGVYLGDGTACPKTATTPPAENLAR